MHPPIFSDAIQAAVIVRNLDAAVRRYADDYGIGPWAILEFNPDTMSDMVIDGEPAEFAMRVAVAELGRLQIELIQPLDERSTYARHLAEHGESLHHLAMVVDDFAKAGETLRAKGHSVELGGRYKDVTFAYFNTQGALGYPIELYSQVPSGQTPDDVYPRP